MRLPHKIWTMLKSHVCWHNKWAWIFAVESFEPNQYWWRHHHDLPYFCPNIAMPRAFRELCRSEIVNKKPQHILNFDSSKLASMCQFNFVYQIHVHFQFPKFIVHYFRIVDNNVQSVKFADCRLECLFELHIISDIAMAKKYALFAKSLTQLFTRIFAGIRVQITNGHLCHNQDYK